MSVKLHLFELGVEASRNYIVDESPGYICPLCLKIFRDPGPLTLEHVPPRSVGGKVLCLLCKSCNNEAGYSADVALHERVEAAQVLRTGQSGRFLKLKIEELSLNGTIERNDEVSQVKLAIEHNNPAKVEEFRSRVRNLKPKAGWPGTSLVSPSF